MTIRWSQEMLIVQVGDFGSDGDAHYRIHAPAESMGAIDGVVCVDVHFRHHLLPTLAEKADVLILQFFSDWDLIPQISMQKKLGKITIFRPMISSSICNLGTPLPGSGKIETFKSSISSCFA